MSFTDLDTNHNNVLGNSDDAISIASRTVGGATKSSTIIDVGLTGIGSQVAGAITPFGRTGIASSDFL